MLETSNYINKATYASGPYNEHHVDPYDHFSNNSHIDPHVDFLADAVDQKRTELDDFQGDYNADNHVTNHVDNQTVPQGTMTPCKSMGISHNPQYTNKCRDDTSFRHDQIPVPYLESSDLCFKGSETITRRDRDNIEKGSIDAARAKVDTVIDMATAEAVAGSKNSPKTGTQTDFPEKVGLYDPDFEKDGCGVGFICHIEGQASHRIVRDARSLLCNMTHRGAVGADTRDGDGAGLMTSMPYEFMREQFKSLSAYANGEFAIGNIFMPQDATRRVACINTFERVAHSVGLHVLEWRQVAHDSQILGPAALSREPFIMQPAIVMSSSGSGDDKSSPTEQEQEREKTFELSSAASKASSMSFEMRLFLLRKITSHLLPSSERQFYICSLSSKVIVYKGQLAPIQVYNYFYDLVHPRYRAHFALVHSRFSTNTFPSWNRAQPLRMIAHNGEINTLRGNKNWMGAREGLLKSERLAPELLEKLLPIIEHGGSDSAALDNVLEFLVSEGSFSICESVMMLIPEADSDFDHGDTVNLEAKADKLEAPKKAFYKYLSCLMEPWDGPALVSFATGRFCGATLDRNGLRPCRFYVTHDNLVVCASEVGTIPFIPDQIKFKGRLEPGKMLLVDTKQGRIVSDDEIKMEAASKFQYERWLSENALSFESLAANNTSSLNNCISLSSESVAEDKRLLVFGYTFEQLNLILAPMAINGKESLGSMGFDSPLACMSTYPKLMYDYFRQMFAQVTNPPIDPIRESVVMSLHTFIGPQRNLLERSPLQCKRFSLQSPILGPHELSFFVSKVASNFVEPDSRNPENSENATCSLSSIKTLDLTFPREWGVEGYARRLDELIKEAEELAHTRYLSGQSAPKTAFILISDRNNSQNRVAVSALAATGAIHHRLIETQSRGNVGLIVETGEAREVHHFCVLLGYGADAICPYLMIETLWRLNRENALKGDMSNEQVFRNYCSAANGGILKVMSKMGISTLQSYKGAQIFEALGVCETLVNKCFKGTPTRIGGISLKEVAIDTFRRHNKAYPERDTICVNALPEAGEYHWRAGGDAHINDPNSISLLQTAIRTENDALYREYTKSVQKSIENCTLRGLLCFDFEAAEANSHLGIEEKKSLRSSRKGPIELESDGDSRKGDSESTNGSKNGESRDHTVFKHEIKLEEVEPWTEIVQRFCTGAMSYGSISREAHSTLAVAMNRLGGKSNTGEGGEDASRSLRNANGDTSRSAIKQVASGRFGVTSFYVSDADELQIKMAQGAKPGEGGELPGHKVSESIAKTRHSTAGVGLISPPPHHDIYSIEDLKQLIYDLKSASIRARISVKLVSEAGVGIVAAGVVKAKADHILISGHDGGTGASRWTGIRNTGLPWELGLAECHQTLVLNDLRGRVTLQTDGQLKTGRDIAIACLLGAEEWGFATMPLIAMGCVMMRKCHLNTCPVGIATQDPILREKFKGMPEHVITLFYYIAEEMREIMAKLGFRTVNEMVGRTDRLRVATHKMTERTRLLNLSPLLTCASKLRPGAATFNVHRQDHQLWKRLDNKFLYELDFFSSGTRQNEGERINENKTKRLEAEVVNTDRAVGATLSYWVSRQYGERGLDEESSVWIKLYGSAGQSFGAFLARGLTLELEGDSNDYVGKGLSGGQIIMYPPTTSSNTWKSHENVIAGNVCLYGATSGEAFISGKVAERFCVRNSGAFAVVEGVGDHGCEYMTGGRVVVLGSIGRNFAAGMSGGIAYILNADVQFTKEISLEESENSGISNGNGVNNAETLKENGFNNASLRLEEDTARSEEKGHDIKKKINSEMVYITDVKDDKEIEMLRAMLEKHYKYTKSHIAKYVVDNFDSLLSEFIRVIPHDYHRVLSHSKAAKVDSSSSLSHSKTAESDSALANATSVLSISSPSENPSSSKADHQNPPPSNLPPTLLSSSQVDRTSLPSNKPIDSPSTVVPENSSQVLDKVRGFIKYPRKSEPYRKPHVRISDWEEQSARMHTFYLKEQAARCMDCGVPFCQSESGCPLTNIIPKWNELVFKGQWKAAYDRLLMTNPFAEFTGRVCPAPCEGACVLGLIDQPVNIKSIECAIIDKAFAKGWVVPRVVETRSGKRVAVIGSGPAGLSCADALNRAGHSVTVYERADRAGGLLMYGIPNMKLDKRIVQRRIDILAQEGITFHLNTEIFSQSTNINNGIKSDDSVVSDDEILNENDDSVIKKRWQEVYQENDAIVLATGSTVPRDLMIPGRSSEGIIFAMDLLHSNTQNLLDSGSLMQVPVNAQVKNKRVIVIGGGDTGNDCLGTCVRLGASSIVNFELLPQPPHSRGVDNPWPQFPRVFRVDYGHSECQIHYGNDPREFCVLSKKFTQNPETGHVTGIETVRVEWTKNPQNGHWEMCELKGTEQFFEADLIVLAMGFVGPEAKLLTDIGIERDQRSNVVKTPLASPRLKFNSSIPKVYACGDARRGQSLVVWALAEGKQCARQVDIDLTGSSLIEGIGGI